MTASKPTGSTLPLVSVVVPCYNQSRYAYEAALSARAAYAGPLQIIFVDDGSTATGRKLEEVRALLSDARCTIEIIRQENTGLSGARNTGLSHVRGRYVQLLDCDDLLLPLKIDRQIEHFGYCADLTVSLTGCLYANEDLDRFEWFPHLMADWSFSLEEIANHWERGLSIPIHCALFDARVFETLRFSDAQRAKEDWVFWTHLVLGGGRIALLDRPGAIYRIHDSSLCRSLPEIGRQWISAAMDIDTIVRDRCPDFLDGAMRWYVEQYAGRTVSKDPEDRTAPTAEADDQPTSTEAGSAVRPVRRPVPPKAIPRVSIVVPVYQHFDFLDDCIASALAQMDGRVELVLVDDASPDPRVRGLLEARSTIPGVTVLFNRTNANISATLDRGIRAARGEFVAFLDCDDMLVGDAIARVLDRIDADGDCDYLFTDHYHLSQSDGSLSIVRYGGYDDDRFAGEFRKDLLNGMVANHLKVIRRSKILEVGGFTGEFTGVQDWDLALRLLADCRFAYLAEPLYIYRVHQETVTRSDRRAQFLKTNLVRRRHADAILGRTRAASALPLKTIDPETFRLRDLPDLYARNRLVFDAASGIEPKHLWHLREFNSYFDQIVVYSADAYAALLGYVWNVDILVLV